MKNPEGPGSIMLSDRTPIESSIESEDIFYTELSRQSPDYYQLITFLINLEEGQDRVNFITKMVKKNQYVMDNVFKVLSGRVMHYIEDPNNKLIEDFLNSNSGFKKPIRKVSSLSVRSSVEKIESEEKFIEELGKDSPNKKNLNFFLINLEPGQLRVNFIAKMVEKNQYAMDNVFRYLVEKGLPGIDVREIKILIDDFINPASNFNIVKDCKGVNHIFNATHHGKHELVRSILERDPHSVNIISKRGASLIHVAVSNRMTEVLNELLNCSKLNLYALRTSKDKDNVTTIFESVFDIAKEKLDKKKLEKHSKIPEMLLEAHKRRFDSGDPEAIAFGSTSKILLQSIDPKYHLNPSATIENSTMSVEGPNGNLHQAIIEDIEGSSSDLAPFNPPINQAVDSDAIGSEIARASDKFTNTGLQMASSLINPDATQASSQLSAESPMVWDGNDHSDCISRLLDQGKITLGDKQIIDRILDDIQPQITGGGAMIGLSYDFSLAPLNTPLTGASTQITDSINENHEERDSQSIPTSGDLESAFRSFKKRSLNSREQEKPDKSAKTTSQAEQSMNNAGRITSTSTSPISQESLSGYNQGKGGSK